MKLILKEHPRLFHQKLENFFSVPPYAPNALERAKTQLIHKSFQRKELVQTLLEYNALIGNDEIEGIKRILSDDVYCVVTGQQLGYMGGPSYTILKAITAIKIAREIGAVPIFWLATDDHDIGEIDHTYILDDQGNIKDFRLSLPRDGRTVEDLVLTQKCVDSIHAFFHQLSLPDSFLEVREGMSYVQVMRDLLVTLFSGTGLVFIEPKVLTKFAKPFFQKELNESEQIAEIIRSTTKKVEAAGGIPIISPIEPTNLFLKEEGQYRKRIHKEGQKYIVGKIEYSKSELLRLIEEKPHWFSTNVASRPVWQSKIIPCIAYVGGPTELQYFQQLKDYFHFHDVAMPWVIPRISATLVPYFAANLLEKCKLEPWDTVPLHWYELIEDIDFGIIDLVEEWEKSALLYFQKDLPESAINRYVRQMAKLVQKKVTESRLDKQGIPYNALHTLRNLLHPHNKPQERVYNWLMFQTSFQENIIEYLLENADWHYPGHHYLIDS